MTESTVTPEAPEAVQAQSNGNLRQRIRASKPKGERYEVPEWGVTVELRSMTIAEKNRLAEVSADSLGKFVPGVLITTCYDPKSGERLFTEEDIGWLNDKEASVVEALMLAGLRISGMSEALGEVIEEGKGVS